MPRIYFQSPCDGHPMVLIARGDRITVEACDCDDHQSCTELECRAILDAREMSRDLAAAGLSSVDERRDSVVGHVNRAARYLAREYRAGDLAAELGR